MLVPVISRRPPPAPVAPVLRVLVAALALTACNYPGFPGAISPTPLETPTSPLLATLPHLQSSGCLESLSVLSESGYLDATPAQAGATVMRTWHVRNSGTCAWSTEYFLVPVEGQSFGLAPVPLAAPVAPGEETDLQVTLTAPAEPGWYSGGWALRSPQGHLLGAGNRPLRVRINVSSPPLEPTAVAYNFVDERCDASWVAASPSRPGRLLPCPGYDRDRGGWIGLDNAPRFSNGALDDEATLVLHPPYEDGGLLSGTYPPYTVQTGDQFRGILGCASGAPACAARVQLNVREADRLHPIGEWLVRASEAPLNLAVDLSFLAGHTPQFVLAVDADGAGEGDTVLWLQPRILR